MAIYTHNFIIFLVILLHRKYFAASGANNSCARPHSFESVLGIYALKGVQLSIGASRFSLLYGTVLHTGSFIWNQCNTYLPSMPIVLRKLVIAITSPQIQIQIQIIAYPLGMTQY